MISNCLITNHVSSCVKGSFPILVSDRWAQSRSWCTGSQPAGDFKPSTWQYAAITFRQVCDYLPSPHRLVPYCTAW